MSSTDLLDLLKLLTALPRAAFWPAVGWLLDSLRDLGSLSTGGLALLMLAAPVGLAFRLQRHLNDALEREPQRRLGFREYLKLELWHSVLAIPLWPLRGAVAVCRGIGRLGRRLLRRRGPKAAETAAPAPAEPGSAPPAPEPVLIATLGPGFLLAGLITVAVYLVARVAEPFLRAELGLSPGLSAWQYLLLGHRPELAWYLPFDRFPFLDGLLTLLLWTILWSLLGIALRMVFQRQLGRNLVADRETAEVLPFWRRWSGVPSLAVLAPSYREWALWPVAAAVPFLVWAWFSMGGDPYRIRPSEMAVAALLWTSWALHLGLHGRERLLETPKAAEAAAETRANGWPEVLARLAAERDVAAPEPWEERRAELLELSETDPRTAGFLSSLVLELLPPPGKLTRMQRSILTKLALQGYVHVDPPIAIDQLSLSEDVLEVLQDRSGLRVRHQIVLAHEGQGKTTLAMLAAANHALVHTRSTLIVVRDERAAAALAERFRKAIERSPLRWNVRVRHPGADLMTDLSRGIIPDVVVCSLHDLVLTVLDRTDTFAPFLRNTGLIVVDDVESFVGPVEVHAQLAFRRLSLRLSDLLGLRELGDQKEQGAPQILILGADSMQETGKWAKSLCGIDAVVRNFSYSARETKERESAELAVEGIRVLPEKGPETPGKGEPPWHRFFRLRDFRAVGGERLAVPWHYRLCGDGRRNLGREPLPLREEPIHYVEAPEDACVVLLEGTWSEVDRESRRLLRAGTRFSRFHKPGGEAVHHAGDAAETIAFVTQVDPDVEMAFTHLDPAFSLASALDVLPRPVIRPPTGLAVLPHLSADLVQHWTEVEDVVRVFGAATTPLLSRLAQEGLLLCEPRVDVDDRANQYAEQVYVRALARAVRPSGNGSESPVDDDGLLPPKVAQVEIAARSLVSIRDRTNLSELGLSDDACAHFVYYPGRIFKDARGSYVVVGRVSEEGEEPAEEPEEELPGRARLGDVLVEPLLADEVSSPRRQLKVRSLRGEPAAAPMLEAAGGSFPEAHQVLLGRDPFEIALEPVEIRVEHIATYRLGAFQSEVRQRALTDQETRERYRDLPLATVALVLIPNPKIRPVPGAAEPEGESRPLLTLEGARILAAALRALLPSLYRGAGESLQVALHLNDLEGRAPEDPLRPEEGLYLFDTEPGGNGTARAIYRDGIEPLLRLCRLVIERVLPLTRLRALYDEWGDERETVAESRGEAGDPAAASHEEDVRHGILQWLDSHLQPEGGPEGWRGRTGDASGYERGEGDAFDLGRCWFSRDGTRTDLVWSRYRWRLSAGNEAIVDVGFDRTTVAEARRLERVSPSLEAEALPPISEIWFLPDNEKEPRSSRESLSPDALRPLQAQASALALQAAVPLAPLAQLLRRHVGGPAGEDIPGRLVLTRHLAAFVRAIQHSSHGGAASAFRSPVETLLRRVGDERAKSLLLAVLLRSCGIEAGLFVGPEGRGMRTAAALPEPSGSREPGVILRHLEAWRTAAGLSALPVFWIELAPSKQRLGRLYVPVSAVTGNVEIGPLESRNAWAFLPLPAEPQAAEAPETGPSGETGE